MDRRELLKSLGVMSFVPLLEPDKTASYFIRKKTFDPDKQDSHLVIYGATPGGVALALRAAREGLNVLLVNHTQHLGGMFVNGLGTMDTLYNGARAPIYDEFRYNLYDYYRNTYGYQSAQYKSSNPGYPKTRFESSVAERLIEDMLGREPLISVRRGYYPVKVAKSGARLETVTFRQMHGGEETTVQGDIFADCSYEGDLAAVSGVICRIGRESREEYGEKHAGIAYTQENFWPPSEQVLEQENFKLVRKMNLVRYNTWSELIMPESTGDAHEAVQAFNIRTTLTNDPQNRLIPGKPENYDPAYLKKAFGHVGEGQGLGVPNQKTSWNFPELIGEQNKYVTGDWAERQRITQKFREATLGLLYFKQNDPSVPEDERNKWKEYGLPKDEYADNGNMPYEIYVREARRIVGRAVFTEHDASLAEGLKRAPVHKDSISVTEWFMDSHACTEHRIAGSKPEGEVMMKNMTFPGQVPFGTIFPKEIDNLIVPVCLSSSHIGWGTIRLEPTWMSICEAAGYAVALAISQQTVPANINPDQLTRLLARKRIMVSFFNDMEGREYAPWYPAVQYLGTQGFFPTYDALPNETLREPLAEAWIRHTENWMKERPASGDLLTAGRNGGEPVKAAMFARRLGRVLSPYGAGPDNILSLLNRLDITDDLPITRGEACQLIFEVSSGIKN